MTRVETSFTAWREKAENENGDNFQNTGCGPGLL